MSITLLPDTILRLSGEGVYAWLDGIVTCTMPPPAKFGALLTPQGKIIADFFLFRDGETALYLATPSKFSDDLEKRLKMFRLRAPITIERADLKSYAIFGDEADEADMGQVDPRHPSLGRRVIAAALPATASLDDYNAHRLSLGVVDSHFDFDTAKVFPADVNMDLLGGVDYKKGCFVGQEVASRMKRMTIAKKRARGIICDNVFAVGDDIMCGERVIGTVMSAQNTMGMAMIRLDRFKSATQDPTLNGAPVQIMGSPDGAE
ncbi:CAF17-like 4Fe-4S cluster assembly/insertion protein YgfZ [Robiginitomaculum antarcticum]|uniref:CAF17-like 4Fe-4S cluster assembly/insertion protein YgfZ n=1 Tax=Robiginitomaculum antarcticum TaxID=437507 RepID=UPI00036FF35A|nr:folate-binding protein YgfZ [Robiginitomaculum antarcticum]